MESKRKKSQVAKNLGSTKNTVEPKISGPIDSEIKFFILRPNKTRRLFAIQAYKEPVRRGKREYFKEGTEIFKELALKVSPINSQFLDNGIDEETSNDMLWEIINEYRKRQGTRSFALRGSRLSKANVALLEKFWQKRYAHKTLVSPEAAYSSFNRALRLAGDISVYTSTPQDFRDQLEKNTKNNDQYRYSVSALNEILKFVGRDFVLSKPEEEYKEVRYINESEVKSLAESAPSHEFKLCTYVLFGTGCRTAEAYAIDPASLGKKSVHVLKQLPWRKKKADAAPRVKKPKRGKQGWVGVITSTWKYVQEWAKLDKTKIDRYAYYNWITSEALKKWPNDKSKHIHPHDLRHSHAIHLLDQGVSIEGVARNLRNRVEICQKYYTGHEHSPHSLEEISSKI